VLIAIAILRRADGFLPLRAHYTNAASSYWENGTSIRGERRLHNRRPEEVAGGQSGEFLELGDQVGLVIENC